MLIVGVAVRRPHVAGLLPKAAQKPGLRLTFQIRLFRHRPQLESQAKRGLVYPRGLPNRSADTTWSNGLRFFLPITFRFG